VPSMSPSEYVKQRWYTDLADGSPTLRIQRRSVEGLQVVRRRWHALAAGGLGASQHDRRVERSVPGTRDQAVEGDSPHGHSMRLAPVANGVFRLTLPPRRFINAYLVGDVLIDAGLPLHARMIVKALAGHKVVTHVITHAHGDHVGGSRSVSDALGVLACCGAGDAASVRAGKPVAASRVQSVFRWKPVQVARELREGDEIGSGFAVLDTPGHSPGHTLLSGGSATAR
jgi:hypothetical protein